MQFVTSLAVDADSERAFELLVPIAQGSMTIARYLRSLDQRLGYAVVNGTSSEHSSGSGLSPTPFLGMGEALAVKEWGPLRERLEKSHSRALDGSPIDPRLIPADWRGLAGFDVLMLEEAEWREIPAPSEMPFRTG